MRADTSWAPKPGRAAGNTGLPEVPSRQAYAWQLPWSLWLDEGSGRHLPGGFPVVHWGSTECAAGVSVELEVLNVPPGLGEEPCGLVQNQTSPEYVTSITISMAPHTQPVPQAATWASALFVILPGRLRGGWWCYFPCNTLAVVLLWNG